MTTTPTIEPPIHFPGPNSAEMIRAILAGMKTQFRQVVTSKNSTVLGYPAKKYWPNLHFDQAETRGQSLTGAMCGLKSDVHLAVPWRHPDDSRVAMEDCGKYQVRPIIQPGDRLWVRESFTEDHAAFYPCFKVCYRANGGCDYERKSGRVFSPEANDWYPFAWRPSTQMPRWASRITLEVTDVRVHRVQEISEADAIAEGVGHGFQMNAGWPDYRHIKNGVCDLTQDSAELSFSSLWDSLHSKHPGLAWQANPWVFAFSFRRLP